MTSQENANKSFSIGKTWKVEDLVSIESFAGMALPPRDDQEARYRDWAGDVGLVVTFAKTRYWRASTAEEKERFVEVMVRRFIESTGGRVPVLRGFDSAHKARIFGDLAVPDTDDS